MFYKVSKRILDIIVSLLAISFFSPLILVVAILIKLDGTGGSILADIPPRIGTNGKPFFIFKFRSMVPNAHELIKNDPKLFELHKKNQGKLKIEEDPRITKIGRFIRKTDIDEMPQFFNVLIGNMSIVGPRAYFRDELDRYIAEFPEIEPKIDTVLSAKPGITGPWQVSGRNKMTIPQRVDIDYNYAQKKSIFYDIYIMIKTPIAVLSRLGVYE